jgi:hypothetical protein
VSLSPAPAVRKSHPIVALRSALRRELTVPKPGYDLEVHTPWCGWLGTSRCSSLMCRRDDSLHAALLSVSSSVWFRGLSCIASISQPVQCPPHARVSLAGPHCEAAPHAWRCVRVPRRQGLARGRVRHRYRGVSTGTVPLWMCTCVG